MSSLLLCAEKNRGLGCQKPVQVLWLALEGFRGYYLFPALPRPTPAFTQNFLDFPVISFF